METTTEERHTCIRPISRQVRRQLERYPVRCARCGEVTDPAEAVFDGGTDDLVTHISHRACAVNINRLVDQMNDDARRKRLEGMGIEVPGSQLLTP